MSDIFPHTSHVPPSDVHQLQDDTWKLGDPIPDPDPETPSLEEELPPATVDITSTQPINWSEAVEVQIVPPTTTDTTVAVLTALRDALSAFGVWDSRDQLEYDKLSDTTPSLLGDLVLMWSGRLVVQLDLKDEEQ